MVNIKKLPNNGEPLFLDNFYERTTINCLKSNQKPIQKMYSQISFFWCAATLIASFLYNLTSTAETFLNYTYQIKLL